ncbi:MAG: hypothetical protein R2725_09845 [Solirubrobacterales bacterium]
MAGRDAERWPRNLGDEVGGAGTYDQQPETQIPIAGPVTAAGLNFGLGSLSGGRP